MEKTLKFQGDVNLRALAPAIAKPGISVEGDNMSRRGCQLGVKTSKALCVPFYTYQIYSYYSDYPIQTAINVNIQLYIDSINLYKWVTYWFSSTEGTLRKETRNQTSTREGLESLALGCMPGSLSTMKLCEEFQGQARIASLLQLLHPGVKGCASWNKFEGGWNKIESIVSWIFWRYGNSNWLQKPMHACSFCLGLRCDNM